MMKPTLILVVTIAGLCVANEDEHHKEPHCKELDHYVHAHCNSKHHGTIDDLNKRIASDYPKCFTPPPGSPQGLNDLYFCFMHCSDKSQAQCYESKPSLKDNIEKIDHWAEQNHDELGAACAKALECFKGLKTYEN